MKDGFAYQRPSFYNMAMQYHQLHFKDINSTNKYLKDSYSLLSNFTFVSTDYQSSGKGREDRVWLSNSGENLMFSLLLKDQKYMDICSFLSIYTAVEIAKLLKTYKIKNVSIKWPNDVFIDNKKACGILLEGQVPQFLVIGVGLNVNQVIFPSDLRRPATSLRKETKINYSIDEIKDKLFSQMAHNFNMINHDSYLSYFRNNNYLLNKRVKVTFDQQDFIGEVIGVDDNLCLQIKSDNMLLHVDSGEITIL